MRDALILVALWCGAVTAIAAALGVVWKVIGPNVDRHIERVAARVTAPLVRDLETVRTEVVSRPDEPSILEAASSAVESAERVELKVDAVGNQIGALRRRVEQVHGTSLITRSVLDQHVEESKLWLGRAVEALEEQGIDLPDHRPGDKEG